MATETKSANTGVNESGWSSPSNITTDDTSCASASLSGTQNKDMYTTFTSSSITGTITEVAVNAIGSIDTSGFQSSATAFFSKDNGSNYCSGHGLGGFSEGSSESCSTVTANGFVACGHTGFGGDLTDTEWNSTSKRWRIRAGSVSDTAIVFVDFLETRVTYTVITVPGAPTWAAQPFPLANRTTAQLQVDWVSGSGDAETGYKLQWDTDASFPTPPTQEIDTASTSTIYTHTGRSTGTRYYYRVRGYNSAGDGAWSTTESTYTEPTVPTGLAVVADAVGQLRIDWNAVTVSPTGTVLYDIQYDTDGIAGGEVDLSINQSGLTATQGSLGAGISRWYWVRAQSPDVDGNGTTEGQYNTKVSGTTWNVPANADLSNATTNQISLVTVTKAISDPSDGGGTPSEPIDTWEVWRADTEFGVYADISGTIAIGTTTYLDNTIAGGETKWYKSKYTNLVGAGAISTNGISGIALENLDQSAGDLLADSRIRTTFENKYEALARSSYDFGTIDQGTDGTSTYDFTVGSGASFSDTGGLFGHKRSIFDGSNNGYLLYLGQPDIPVGSSFTYGCYIKFDTLVAGKDPLIMGGSGTNSQRMLFRTVTDGGISLTLETRSKTSGNNTVTHDFGNVSTGIWYLFLIVHNQPNDEVDFWINNVKTSLTDGGTYDFDTESARYRIGGYIVDTYATMQATHAFLILDFIPTLSYVNKHISTGSFFDAGGDPITDDSRIKVLDNLVESPIKTPDSQWDFNTTNTGTDQIGLNSLSPSGTVTYSNTGGAIGVEGYASFDGTTPESRLATGTATYPGGIENGSITLIYFVWNDFWETGSKWYGGISTGSNNDYILSLSPSSSGNTGHRISFRYDNGGATNTQFSVTKPTGTWLVHAMGYDGDNGEAFMWMDETNYSASASAGTWGWDQANGVIQLGGISGAANNDTNRISHARMYVNFVPTLADIQYFKANGEFEGGVFSADTRIKVIPIDEVGNINPTSEADIFQAATDHPFSGGPPVLGVDYFGHLDKDATGWVNIINQEVLANAIRFEYYSTGDPITSDSWVEKIGEISRVSDSAILNVVNIDTIIANSAVHRIGYDTIEKISIGRIKREGFAKITPLPTSFSRIIKTLIIEPEAASTIFHSAWDSKELTSDSRIIIEGTLMIPPMYSDSWILWVADDHVPGVIGHIDKLADTFVIHQYIKEPIADTAIHRPGYNIIEPTADSIIFRADYGLIEPQSDSAVFVASEDRVDIYGQIDINSDTRIFRPAGRTYPFQKGEANSSTTIRKTMPIKERKSNSLVIVRPADGVDSLTPITADTLVIHNPKASDPMYSDTLIIVVQKIDPPVYGNTRIKIFDQEITPILGDSAVFRTEYNTIDIIADTLIHYEFTINTGSDSRVLKTYKISNITADTYIINLGTGIPITSNTAIFIADYGLINVKSYAAIYISAYDTININSDAIVLVTQKIPVIYSDSSIRRDRSNITAIFQKGRQL